MNTSLQTFLHRFIRHQRIFFFIALVVFLFLIVSTHAAPADWWLAHWWMFPVAFLVALTANTAGISSAALFVPFFILIFPLLAGAPLPAVNAVKLGLITESFGLSSSALAFIAFGLTDFRIAVQSIAVALPFVLSGALIAAFVPSAILFLMVAALLIVSVLLLRFERTLVEKRTQTPTQPPEGVAHSRKSRGFLKRSAGLIPGGFFQGATGFGIGEMGIISMLLSHVPIRTAIGTSHLIVATTAIAASAAHFLLAAEGVEGAAFPWNIPAMTVPAVIIGGQLAPYVAARLPVAALEKFVSVIFLVIAVALIALALTT